MKCVKIEGAKSLITAETAKPESIDGAVIVKVESCGICGSDIHYWESGEPKGLILGHELAGTVVYPGARTDLKEGDRITGLPISPCWECEACKTGNIQYCKSTWSHAVGLSLDYSGGYAEYSMIHPKLVKKIPDELSFDEGAMIEPAAVSLHATNLADIKVGEKVLVIGSGIIGLMAMEFARKEGASYIAVLEVNKKRGEKAVKLGAADCFFDASDPNTIEKLKEASNGGFDKVIECCGNSAAITEAIMCTKPGGTIVLVGISLGAVSVPLTVAVMSEVKLQGAIAYNEKEFSDVIDLVAKGQLDVKKYIDATIPLDDANEAFERLTSGTDDAIKIIFHPND